MPSFTLNVSCRDQSRFFFICRGGKTYLAWKQNSIPSAIILQEIQADGLHFSEGTKAKVLLVSSLLWDFEVVEAPWILYRSTVVTINDLKSYFRVIILTVTLCSPLLGSPITTSSFHPTLSKALFITSGLQEVWMSRALTREMTRTTSLRSTSGDSTLEMSHSSLQVPTE